MTETQFTTSDVVDEMKYHAHGSRAHAMLAAFARLLQPAQTPPMEEIELTRVCADCPHSMSVHFHSGCAMCACVETNQRRK
jgi:hypothetical protein